MTTDLVLSGTLNLSGLLNLSGSGGGKVKVGTSEILVVSGRPTGIATIPVLQPPPPAGPLNTGLDVTILQSFNATVTIGGMPVVAQGICMQGNPPPIWPGMVLPSVNNQVVTISGVRANVKGDQGITLPSGGSITFDASGQSP